MPYAKYSHRRWKVDMMYNMPNTTNYKQIKTTSVAFSPQANFSDWATVADRRIFVPTSADRGVSRGQRGGR
jgi:hypothetical protein